MPGSHSSETLSRGGIISAEFNKNIVCHGAPNIPWIFIACVASQQWRSQTWPIENFNIVMMYSIFKIEGCELELKWINR